MKFRRRAVLTVTIGLCSLGLIPIGGVAHALGGAASTALPPSAPVVVSSSAAGVAGNAATNAESAAWSPDGTKVAFTSTASNLVPGDTAGTTDLFVKNLATGSVTRVPGGGGGRPTWAPDGGSIAFWRLSTADPMCADLRIWTISATTTRLGAQTCNGPEYFFGEPTWDPTSRHIAAEIEYSRSSALWSVDLTGPAITSDQVQARTPTFSSGGDLATAELKYRGADPVGEFSVYTTDVAVNGTALWNPVKLRDHPIECPEDGCWSGSSNPSWQSDGSRLAYVSNTPSAGDTNGANDVFAQDPATSQHVALSRRADGTFGNAASRGLQASSGAPVWSPDGKTVLFQSLATNLVPGDTAGTDDIFAKRIDTGAIERVASASDAALPSRWNFNGTWPVLDTVAPSGAAAGAWFRDGLWSPNQTRLLYPSTSGQLQMVTVAGGNAQPTASFTAARSGAKVTVDASASADPDGSIVSYAWRFGDGSTASGRTPAAHTYADAGKYTITLTVRDNKGATDAATRSVTVTDVPVGSLGLSTITSARPRDHAARLAWRLDGGTTKPTAFRIQARAAHGSWRTIVANTGSTARLRRLTGLHNGTAYRFRVTPLAGSAVGRWSAASEAVTPFGRPGQPGKPSIDVIGKHQAKITWSAAAANGARVTYDLQRWRKGHWRELTSTGKTHWKGTIAGKAKVKVRVVAHNAAGAGPAGEAAKARLS